MGLHYENELLELHSYVSGFSNNAWLIVSKAYNQSVIIDTPRTPKELITAATNTNVVGILITHNHSDHLEGFDSVKQEFADTPVGIGVDDAEALKKLGVAPTLNIVDGSEIVVGDLILRAVHTPGHTPGSTCFYLDGRQPHLFSGDTLFPGGPGKTDNPSDFKKIVEAISSRLLTLPTNTIVHPGHGPDTIIGEAEIEYKTFASKSHPEDLAGDVTWLG